MKSLRERFEEEYAAVSVPADNKKGFAVKYVYYAPWYIWDLPEKDLRTKKALMVWMSLGSLFLYLFAGSLYTPVNTDRITVLLALLGLCAHVLELTGVLRFGFAKYRTTKAAYTGADRALKLAALIRGCCLLAAALSGLVCLMRNTFDTTGILAVLGYLICSGMAFYIFLEYRKIPFRTEKNESLKQYKDVL